LDDLVVVRQTPLTVVNASDTEIVRELFESMNGRLDQGALDNKLMALNGGRIYFFDSEEHLREVDQALLKIEQLPGPDTDYGTLDVLMPLDGTIEYDLSELVLAAQAAASDWTATKKTFYVIRVDFADKPGAPADFAELWDKLNGTVSDSLREMSYGKVWLEADVTTNVIRLPQASVYYAPDEEAGRLSRSVELYDDAVAAFDYLNTGVDLSAFDIVAVLFSDIGMPWGGKANIGGARQWLQNTSAGTILHEIGHNLGLGHANYWDTDGLSVIGAGVGEEYGDIFDRMGSGPFPEGHFNPQSKIRLNWLTPVEWRDVTIDGSGTYRLYRFDDADSSGIRALRVSRGAGDHYWLGYRRNYADNQWLSNGIYLTWQCPDPYFGHLCSYLLDTTPGSTQGKADAAVVLSRTYSDSDAGIHITPVAQGGVAPHEWIDVIINTGPFGNNRAPEGALSGPITRIVGNAATFTAEFTDPDGDSLHYFWQVDDSQIKPDHPLLGHVFSTPGLHTIAVTVSDTKGGSVTQELQVTVTDPLDQWGEWLSAKHWGNWQAPGEISSTPGLGDLETVAHGNGKILAAGRQLLVASDNGTTWEVL
ncbi:MAG: PKD domain-containing protein, partial [Gammaproteobacteria bacterium]|nr:PKD domain-containing protein [Gammaproteobacteria bacterium]